MNSLNPLWVAPRKGHDRRDEDILRATNWLRSFVPSLEIDRRIDAARDQLISGKSFHSPTDLAAWYISQAESSATDRKFWVPEIVMKIAPIMTRIGQNLDELRSIEGVEGRAARLMNEESSQPDSGLFELLVALAYRLRGWSKVEFVPEQPGRARTPDLIVSRPRRRWAIECKRAGTSRYHVAEKDCVEVLADPVQQLSLVSGRSVILEVIFHCEIKSLPCDYLANRVASFLEDPQMACWKSTESVGRIRDVDWRLIREVLRHDVVYFGSSRMIELLLGTYDHQFEYTMAAKWRPDQSRPLFADAVYQASVVCWSSRSKEAMHQKSRHFRSILAKANDQLTLKMPGAVHVGVESWGGFAVDATRHIRNSLESRDFDPKNSRLRWVYGNYFAPEITTQRNESWAINETMVPYKIGRHSTGEPLPGHLLLVPDDKSHGGAHWAKS